MGGIGGRTIARESERLRHQRDRRNQAARETRAGRWISEKPEPEIEVDCQLCGKKTPHTVISRTDSRWVCDACAIDLEEGPKLVRQLWRSTVVGLLSGPGVLGLACLCAYFWVTDYFGGHRLAGTGIIGSSVFLMSLFVAGLGVFVALRGLLVIMRSRREVKTIRETVQVSGLTEYLYVVSGGCRLLFGLVSAVVGLVAGLVWL
jgi:hypothetical protein